MRYLTFEKFGELIGDKNDILEEVLNANNVAYNHHTIDSFNLDDGDLDSLVELDGEKGNPHCAVYHQILIKGRSVGMTTSVHSQSNECCWVTVVYGLNMNQLVELYKRTMKLKAFL